MTERKTSDREMEQIAKRTADALSKQPKVRVRIASRDGDDSPVKVGINGCFFTVNRGETVDVPQAVADLLANGGYL